ncbi:glycoside hydrolase family 2 protein [Inconstantimicrobium mannanitabidum]|uniref:Beta-galactosidase n=1 Tax=Inconstantimicrobium mannanitabidum TaxID=1604901 RepID=A0ACB5R7H9_9CLOT|nr:glycoside hydrolase family 2 protein [Clostridium sp. TW13]GKX65144.1 beta-galactosidase [Clostridium sp. TW13]
MREIIGISNGWKFAMLDAEDVLEFAKDNLVWEEITLPHTWNAMDCVDVSSIKDYKGNSYLRGIGVYFNHIVFYRETYEGKQIYLEFEGANTVTEVYINGVYVGKHEGGYSAFRFNITDYVKLDEDTFIIVKVDNAETTYIAPLASEGDFTKFGGIYRDVNIIAVNGVHIDLEDYGADGVYISYEVSEDLKSVEIITVVKIANETDKKVEGKLETVFCDGEENIILTMRGEVSIKAFSVESVELKGRIYNPHLWNGLKDPYLYKVMTSVLNNGKIVDELSISTGLRSYSVDNNTFYLNGEVYSIHGVNYHQDSYENGWAMDDRQRIRDYDVMLNMGVTAVRMAHYQHDKFEYSLCDETGILVYSEIPLINRSKSKEFKIDWNKFCGNIKQQLVEMIRQNFNHPSVILWGISNELYDVDDDTCKLYKELCSLAKLEDRSRMTIYADNTASNSTDKRSKDTDLIGYNRYDGWYYSKLGDMSKWIGEKIAQNNYKPACISEYGAGGAVSHHMEEPNQKDIVADGTPHYEEYQATFHEETWADIASSGKVWGSFIWCMFDFASHSRVEGDTLGINDKGLVTRNRLIYKDAYYFYQSIWSHSNTLHITSSRMINRANLIPEVKIYSNALMVELFVGNENVGVVKAQDLDSYHNTVFKFENVYIDKGIKNQVRAVATYSDGTTKDEMVQWVGVG